MNPNADVCVNCGVAIKKQAFTQSRTADSGLDELLDIGLIIVSILFPLIGFIVGAVKKTEDPVKAAKYTKAASISLGVEVTVFLLLCLFIFVVSEM